MDLKEKIIEKISEHDYSPIKSSALCSLLSNDDKGAFFTALNELEDEGGAVVTKSSKVGLPSHFGMVLGVFSGTDRGFGFVTAPEYEGDIFIPAPFVGGAYHKDTVLVKVKAVSAGGLKAEGEVVKVCSRGTETVTGRFERFKNRGFVIPDNKKFSSDIYIAPSGIGMAKDGDKIVCRIINFGGSRRNPEGVVERVLGKSDTRGASYEAVLYEHSIKTKFDPETLADAKSVAVAIPKEEISRRRDFRDKQIITIDGADAKDLDDAVCVERIPNGYRLSVHIADVSYYVRWNSPLDREAYERGTSVYFADCVVPMLPEELSNGICSLNPNEDRLVMSCVMDFDNMGKMISHELCEGVIKTCHRMTYDDVTAILENDTDTCVKYADITDMLALMNELFKILNANRVRKGMLDFEIPESKVILDQDGQVEKIVLRERTVSHRIVEEFMLSANECVAEHFFWLKKPCIYRVHETPNAAKTEVFLQYASVMGYTIKGKTKDKIHPKQLQELLKEAEGKPEEIILSNLMLRSMMKARYSEECLGHYGLASEYYCHFTSPIRRYPDLVTHRSLRMLLTGQLEGHKQASMEIFVKDAAKQSTDREMEAVFAERDIDDLFKAEYMSRFIGQEFDGIISSITSFGFFVVLPDTIEGLVHVENLKDDYYIYDEKFLTLTGKTSGKVYKMGQPVRVVCTAADISSRRIDFSVV